MRDGPGGRRWSRGAVALALAAACLAPANAWAQAAFCPVPAGASPALGMRPATERLWFLRRSLWRASRRASTWLWSWRTISAIGVGEIVLLPAFDDPGDRASLIVGSSAAAVGLAATFALPVRTAVDDKGLEERIARAGVNANACALVADAELVLARDARSEHAGKQWFAHVIGIAPNIAAGLVIGIAYDKWATAGVGAATGIASAELEILTQPTDAIDSYDQYRSGQLAPRTLPALPRGWGVAPLAGHGVAGFQILGAM